MTGFARVMEMDAERRKAAGKIVDELIDEMVELFGVVELQEENRDGIKAKWIPIVLRLP
jgi:hypothetical protein